LSYDGPCPPLGVTPLSHEYAFTVYAFDEVLPVLAAHGEFSAGAEDFYHTVIGAARDRHLLASATLVSHFSAATN